MSYFYARAKELAGPGVAVDDRKFRHAGPKPQSREAALIMLADGVEASVRSLASRDEPAIRGMVTRIIEERVADGQFDECDLTLRDLELIREAFVGQLLGHVPHADRLSAEHGRRARIAPGGRRRGNGDRHGIVTRAIYVGPWRVDLTVRDGVRAPARRGGPRPDDRSGPRRRGVGGPGADARIDRARSCPTTPSSPT